MKLLLIYLVLCTGTVFSQSITKELGAITSNFKLVSNTIELEIKKQFIMERAVSRVDYSNNENQSYGYGYAFQAPHLEFTSTNTIQTRNRLKTDPRKSYNNYIIEFIDKDGKVLTKKYIQRKSVRAWTNEDKLEPLISYSICLKELPMILLDDTATISIIRIHND